jgi:WYL domain
MMSEQPTETPQQQAGTLDRGKLHELTNGERLVQAILDHRVVEFGYQGYRRTVEPYLLGLHEAGEPLLLGIQTAGGSQSGEIPGWRTFITTGIDEVELTDRSFTGPPADFNPYGHSMLEIFARA